MEMAKVTSKGQITIPVSIRRRLQINEGDKLLFIDSPDGVIMVNPDMLQGGRFTESKIVSSDNKLELPVVINETAPEVRIAVEQAVEPEVTASAAPELVEEYEPAVIAEIEPELEPELAAEYEPEVEPETEPELIAEYEPEVEVKTEPELATEYELDAETEAEPEIAPIPTEASSPERSTKGVDVAAILNEIRSIGSKIK